MSASRAEDPGFPGSNPACAGIFPCQAPGVIGSVLGLVGPMSIYCDWVIWKVWQHVKLPAQIRP